MGLLSPTVHKRGEGGGGGWLGSLVSGGATASKGSQHQQGSLSSSSGANSDGGSVFRAGAYANNFGRLQSAGGGGGKVGGRLGSDTGDTGSLGTAYAVDGFDYQ